MATSIALRYIKGSKLDAIPVDLENLFSINFILANGDTIHVRLNEKGLDIQSTQPMIIRPGASNHIFLEGA